MTFPAILSEVLPERLSPGRGLFIPLSRDVFKMEIESAPSTQDYTYAFGQYRMVDPIASGILSRSGSPLVRCLQIDQPK